MGYGVWGMGWTVFCSLEKNENMNVNKINGDALDRLLVKYPDILKHVDREQPDIRQDGTAFICISGPGPAEGIYGSGHTPEEALEDWEKAFNVKNAGT